MPCERRYRLDAIRVQCHCLAEAVPGHDGRRSHIFCAGCLTSLWSQRSWAFRYLLSPSLMTLTCRIALQFIFIYPYCLSILHCKLAHTHIASFPDGYFRIELVFYLVASSTRHQVQFYSMHFPCLCFLFWAPFLERNHRLYSFFFRSPPSSPSFFFFFMLALGLWGQDVMCHRHVLVCLYTSLRYLSSSVVDSITLTLRTVRIIPYLLFCSS